MYGIFIIFLFIHESYCSSNFFFFASRWATRKPYSRYYWRREAVVKDGAVRSEKMAVIIREHQAFTATSSWKKNIENVKHPDEKNTMYMRCKTVLTKKWMYKKRIIQYDTKTVLLIAAVVESPRIFKFSKHNSRKRFISNCFVEIHMKKLLTGWWNLELKY